jgi:4'-phosphopantetheinyl transferase
MFSADGLAVHVWRLDLDAARGDSALDPGQCAATLSQDERDRAAGLAFEADRRRFVAARTALRSILAAAVGIPAGELELEYGSRGKPALAPWCRVADLRFNLSHSQGCALVAVTYGHEVGVDVEQVRHLSDAEAIVNGEFSSGERAVFEALPAAARKEAFFHAWARKEAFLKATGEGLSRRLADAEVTFAPHEPARLLAVSGDACASRRWSMSSLTPRRGYVGAVVVEAPALRLVLHTGRAVADAAQVNGAGAWTGPG